MKLRRNTERGATLIEIAIIAPLLILMALGVADAGRLLFTQITLHEAVQEGSLYVSRNPSDPAGGRTRVVQSVDDPSIEYSRVTVDCPSGSSGPVRIRLEYDVDLLTPVLGGGSVTLDAEVIGDRFSTDACSASP